MPLCFAHGYAILEAEGQGNDMGILPKDIELLPPYDDRIFKVLLTAPEAKPTLLYIASAIVNRPVVDVLIRNNEMPISDMDEKAERFDVNCKIDDDFQADIEMQSSRMEEEPGSNHSNLRARSIYNLCDLHSSQSSKGRAYNELVQTYQVMFCGYTVFADRQDFINPFSIRHDIDNGLLHDAVKVLFVELSKLNEILKKPVDEMTDMERISVFLRYAENPDYRDVVNKVMESKEGLVVAGEVLMSISKDEREQAIFRSRRIYQADLESNRVTAERNIAIEKKKAVLVVARNLLDFGDTADKIALVTGLTREEVETLNRAN
jgi:predicted transposase/invertase (TIGR01784 family)